jgi:IS1 family transposase
MTGAAKGTVLRLLTSVGKACSQYQDLHLRRLKSKRIECDEIWSFCYAKQKNVPRQYQDLEGYGSIWTWVALDPDTKLVASWYVGRRDIDSAYAFLLDLEPRLKNEVQLTTDGFRAYQELIPTTFGSKANYGVVEKQYGTVVYETDEHERRYSPHQCIGMVKKIIKGELNENYISTSMVERQNLTMRMGMRRFTRLTNAFSKKMENLSYAVSLHFMYYNFCRPHMSLNRRAMGITPAMAAGVTDHTWRVEEIVSMADNTLWSIMNDMPSVGVARHQAEEVDTEEKRTKLIAAYKIQWKCEHVTISEPDSSGWVSIYENSN